jgi:hypothetical protein
VSLGKYVLSATLLFVTGSFLIAADAPKAAPPATQPAKTGRLVEPWNLLKTLTPQQTTQIEKIHADALEQEKKIKQKEGDDILALLTPDQQTELKMAEAKHKQELKEKNAAKKKAATTEPMK